MAVIPTLGSLWPELERDAVLQKAKAKPRERKYSQEGVRAVLLKWPGTFEQNRTPMIWVTLCVYVFSPWLHMRGSLWSVDFWSGWDANCYSSLFWTLLRSTLVNQLVWFHTLSLSAANWIKPQLQGHGSKLPCGGGDCVKRCCVVFQLPRCWPPCLLILQDFHEYWPCASFLQLQQSEGVGYCPPIVSTHYPEGLYVKSQVWVTSFASQQG